MFLLDEKKDKALRKPKKELTPLRRRLRLAVRIILGVAVLFGVSLTVLHNLGGSHEALKLGVQDYMRTATGLEARVGRLTAMTFFPVVSVDMGDIELTHPKSGDSVIRAGNFRFATGFWDLFFSRDRLHELILEDLEIEGGLYTRKPLEIRNLALEKAGENSGALIVTGRYDGRRFSGRTDIAYESAKPRGYFKRPEAANIEFESALLTVRGRAVAEGGDLLLTLDQIKAGGNALSGKVQIGRTLAGNQTIEADLQEGESRFVLDLVLGSDSIRGDITIPVLDPNDLRVLQALGALYDEIAPRKEAEATLISEALRVDLSVEVEKLLLKGHEIGSIQADFKLKDGLLSGGPFKGAISGGALNGRLELNAQARPATMTFKAEIDDLSFDDLQDALFGKTQATARANVNIVLSSQFNTLSAMLPNLQGEAVLLGGEGTFESRFFDIWAAGLLRTMLPGLMGQEEMRLNCMIADFKIDKGIARTDPLFIDTNHVRIVGDGTINIPRSTMDIKLKPESKETSFLHTATAVRVRGNLKDPQIQPDLFSLGETLGGLLLGTINPVFLAFSLTDLGVTSSHPCSQFIGAKE